MRKLLGKIFSTEADFEVQFARNGLEALALLDVFKPDVVTLDIHMPQMDGLACLDRIMVEHPCPVVMVSSLTAEGAETTLAGPAARRHRLRRQARGRDLAPYRGTDRGAGIEGPCRSRGQDQVQRAAQGTRPPSHRRRRRAAFA